MEDDLGLVGLAAEWSGGSEATSLSLGQKILSIAVHHSDPVPTAPPVLLYLEIRELEVDG